MHAVVNRKMGFDLSLCARVGADMDRARMQMGARMKGTLRMEDDMDGER